MKKWNAAICIAAAIAVMLLTFQPGYRIVLNGTPLPGIYEPDTAVRCSVAATRAAAEITAQSEPSPFTLVPVFCIRHTAEDESELYHKLLTAYDGVVKLYAVSVNGRPIGNVASMDEVYRIKDEFFLPHTEAPQITVKATYTRPDTELSADDVRAVFRSIRQGEAA